MSDIVFHPIGVIHSPFKQQEGTPIQSALAGHTNGWIDVDPLYLPALQDLQEVERIWILYHLDRTSKFQPLVTPYLDTAKHGLFATRSPARPNPIGMSVLRLLAVAGARIDVEGPKARLGQIHVSIDSRRPAKVKTRQPPWSSPPRRGPESCRAS